MNKPGSLHSAEKSIRIGGLNIFDISRPYDMEGGIPLKLYLILTLISIAALKTGLYPHTGIIGSFAVLWTIGLFFFAIGERIHFVKHFLGGGVIFAYAGAALIGHWGVLSTSEIEQINDHMIGNKFLYFFLAVLVSSSILSLPPKVLKTSLFAYFPIIFCGLGLAALMGVAAGWMVGFETEHVILNFFLPIMGGGSGAGAIPMSEIYADVTGSDAKEYYSFAIAVLTLGNIVAVLAASMLNLLGEKFPALTGHGALLRNAGITKTDRKDIPKAEIKSIAAIVLVICIILISSLLYGLVKAVHIFAWVAIISVCLSLSGLISDTMKASLSAVSLWGLKAFLVAVMVTVGLSSDLGVLKEIFEFGSILVILFVVIGAALGAGLGAYLFKCYPVEGAIAGGLCMANTGGSGDLQVLGAARRMELYPYAQISSRLGGALVLLLANYLFALFLVN